MKRRSLALYAFAIVNLCASAILLTLRIATHNDVFGLASSVFVIVASLSIIAAVLLPRFDR
jgi:hypothetical protein